MSLDLDLARERFESSTDFTIGLEEEFAILDPATLELEHRFEDVYAACQEDEVLAESAAGELIASEIEIRSGRAESFAEAVATPARAPRPAVRAGRRDGPGARRDRHPSLGRLPRPADHRHRRTTTGCAHELGWVAQRNNTWSLHVHMGVRGADRAIAVCDWLRELLPLLLAVSANSPFLDRRDTGLHTVRTEIFTRTFPRCGVPAPFGDWDTLRRASSACWSGPARWSSRPSSGGACARTTASARSRCGSATRRPAARSPSRLAGADRRLHRPGGARLRRARLRRRRGAARRPRDRGEPLAGDPPRDERRDDRLPPRARRSRRARRSSSCSPGPSRPARSSGIEVELPERNGAQRAREALDAGASIEDIYRDAVAETKRTYTAPSRPQSRLGCSGRRRRSL